MEPQARPYNFLNFGYKYRSDCFTITDAETGMVVHSLDIIWHEAREPPFSPAPAIGSGVSNRRNAGLRVHPAATCCYCHAHHRFCTRSQLRPHRCLHQLCRLSPHKYPCCHGTPRHQAPIALFGNWGTRWTCTCLDAREARRVP